MAVPYYGDFPEDATVRIPFNTFDSNDPSASVTITDLADSDIMVHKDGGTTQIATDGATVAINFDSITGNHYIAVDTSAHADYATGSEYAVRIEGVTVDGATLNAWIGAFSIERSGGVLALLKGTNSLANIEDKIDIIDTNVDQIEAAVITNAAGTDIAADIIAVKAETATIVADTNELQTDDVPGLIASLDTVVDRVEADTQDIQSRLPAALSSGNMKVDVLAVSGSTDAADKLEAHALETLPVTFTGGTTTTAILGNVDGATASSTDDVYIGRVLVFNAGTLNHQIAEITDYDGGTTTATISAVTTAVTSSHTARMV